VKEEFIMQTSTPYLTVSASVFAAVSLAHLLRAANAWALTLGDWPVPVGASWLAAVASAVLSAWAIFLLRKAAR
jgi:hypothetical protein